MSEGLQDENRVEFVYKFVGVAIVDDKYSIVTGQCAGKAAAIRQAFSYCDQHGLGRESVQVCELRHVIVPEAQLAGLDPLNKRVTR